MFEAQADPLKFLRVLALLYHARSRASVGCGGSLIDVSAARQHLGIPASRGGRASFQRSALEHGRVSSWSCCRVVTQPCWRRWYVSHLFPKEKRVQESLLWFRNGFGTVLALCPWLIIRESQLCPIVTYWNYVPNRLFELTWKRQWNEPGRLAPFVSFPPAKSWKSVVANHCTRTACSNNQLYCL